MAQTTDRTLAAQKRAEARRAKKQARRENQWAQGSLLVFVLVYNLVFQLVLVPLGKAIWAAALNVSPLSEEAWTELAEEMGVNMEEYASLLDAA